MTLDNIVAATHCELCGDLADEVYLSDKNTYICWECLLFSRHIQYQCYKCKNKVADLYRSDTFEQNTETGDIFPLYICLDCMKKEMDDRKITFKVDHDEHKVYAVYTAYTPKKGGGKR